MFNTLKQKFNQLRENTKLREAHKKVADAVGTAIAKHDADGLASLSKNVPEKERFLLAYGQDMMVSATEEGHLPTFQAAYAYLDKPNMILRFVRYAAAGRIAMEYIDKDSLLAHAINKSKPNIAEFLANDPRVNIRIGQYCSPLKNAQSVCFSGSMDKVVHILSLREAELLQKEAQEMVARAKNFA